MTRIGLVSDTHMPSMGKDLPPQLVRAFAGVDLILHAGDIFIPECLDQLAAIAPVIAVEEGSTPATSDPRVKHEQVIEVGGHVIGLRHDFQLGTWEIMPGSIAQRLAADDDLSAITAKVFGRPVDTVVFGHTHYAMVERHRGMLFVNPGSPTLPSQQRRLGTVGFLEITADKHEGWIVDLTKVE